MTSQPKYSRAASTRFLESSADDWKMLEGGGGGVLRARPHPLEISPSLVVVTLGLTHLRAFVLCRTHFDYEKMKPEELSFQREDVFHVWDTMHNGVIGSWHAQRVTKTNVETEAGVVPNKCRYVGCVGYLA